MAKKIGNIELADNVEQISVGVTPIEDVKKQSKLEFAEQVEQDYKPIITPIGGDFGESKYDEGMTYSQALDYQTERANRQPWTEQAAISIGGGVYKGALGILKDVGYLLDFDNNVKRLAGIEEVDTNWWSEIFENAQKSFDENNPIYRYNPEKVIDWSDPGFYWSAIQGVVESAVEFGGVGFGAGATVGKGLKYLTGLSKLGMPVQNAIATIGTAATTNYAEGKVMALELFKGTVDKRMQEVDKELWDKAMKQAQEINLTLDPRQITAKANEIYASPEYQQIRATEEKKIRTIAGDEANKFQARNMAFMLSDALAIHGMFRGKGFSRNLLKDKSFANTAGMIAKQAPTEYFEEVGQGVLQKEGEYQAMKEAGMDVSEISSDPVKRVWSFIADEQTQLEGLMGLFGGPVQHVLVQVPTNAFNRESDKDYRKAQKEEVEKNQQVLSGLLTKQASYEKAKHQAMANGDLNAFKAVQEDQFRETAFGNFARGTTEDLENKLKAVAEMAPEEAADLGYEPTYKEDAEARLEQLGELETEYLKILRNFSGPKDHILHKKLYDINTGRKTITGILENLDVQKQEVLDNIRKEVQTVDKINISDNQMKLEDLNLQIQSLRKQRAYLTATKNEALLKPNKKLEKARQTLEIKSEALRVAEENRAYNNYSDEQIKELGTEVQNAQDEYNRLSQFADAKTKNKRTVDRVNRAYKKQVLGIDQQLDKLTKERDVVKKEVQDAGERISAFNKDDYSVWDEAVDIQNKIDKYTMAKKLYDNQYKEIKDNKEKYIKDYEEVAKEDRVEGRQKDVDAAESPQAKRDIINKEEDPEVKEELEKTNENNIQNQERERRVEEARNAEQRQKEFEEDEGTLQEFDEETGEVIPPTKTTEPEVTTTVQEEAKTDSNIKEAQQEERFIDDDTVQEVEDEIDDTQDKVAETNKDIETVDDTGVVYSTTRTKRGYNLLAYLSRLYNKILNGNRVEKSDINDDLNENLFLPLLNPNKYNKGTKIILSAVEDPGTIINAETGETWGQQNITDKTSDDYINTVPIVIKDTEGNVLGHLHQDSWINEENVSGDIEQSKKTLRSIREKIIKDGSFETTISKKTLGYLFRSTEGAQTTKDMVSDPNVKLAIGGNGVLFSNQDLSNLNISNKNRIKAGTTYMVVQTGKDEKGEIYTAIPLLNKRINEIKNYDKTINSVVNAIRIHYKLNTVGFDQLSKGEQAVVTELVKDENGGYDLGSLTGLKFYINQFIHVFDSHNNDIDREAKSRFPTGYSNKTLLSIDGTQIQIFFNQPVTGKKRFINTHTGKDGKPLTSLEQLEKALVDIEMNVLPNMYANIDKQSIKSSEKGITAIVTAQDGSVSTETMFSDYMDYIKENTKTDVLSKEVDKDADGNPIYTYTVQPRIELDFSQIAREDDDNTMDEPDSGLDFSNAFEGADDFESYEEGSMEIQDNAFPSIFGNVENLPELDEEAIENFKEKVAGIIIEGLDSGKQGAMVDILFKEALTAILQSEGAVNVGEIYENVFKEVQANLNRYAKNAEVAKRNLKKATENKNEAAIERFTKDVAKMEYATKLFETYMLNQDRLIKLTKDKLDAEDIIKATDLNEDGNIVDIDEQNNTKLYNKSSYEENRDSKASREVKRFLASIREYKSDGTLKTNDLGREKYMGYEEVYKQLQVLTENTVPDYEQIMSILKDPKNQRTFPYLKDVVNRLEDDSRSDIEFIRNELVMLLTNHYSNSQMIMFSESEGGGTIVRIMESNANSVRQTVKDVWDSMLSSSSIIKVEPDGTEILDGDKVDKLIKQQEEWAKNPPAKATPQVKAWMNSLGIVMSDNTWKELEEGNFSYAKGKFNTWEQLFQEGPFAILTSKYLKPNRNKSIEGNLPTGNTTTNHLAKLEAKHSSLYHSNSHREGKKTIYSFGTNKLITDKVRDYHRLEESKDSKGNIVYTNKLITDKYDAVFNKRSSWLKDMMVLDKKGNPKRAKNGQIIVNQKSPVWANMNFFTMSLEALKKQGQTSRDNRELDKLSLGEIEFVKLGLLAGAQADKTGESNRIISLLYPTTSDKTTVMGLAAKAMDIKFDYATSEVTEDVIDQMYEALVLPELERIRHINLLEEAGKEINFTDDYKKGSRQFLFLSELNNPEYGLFLKDGTLSPNAQAEKKDIIKGVIRKYIDQLVEEKMQIWRDAGLISDKDKNLLIDRKYFSSFKVNNKAKAVATDMVIQYLVGNANTFQTFIGDPALFYKKNIEETWINIGKRLAADIAPGEQGDGTMNNTYKQVFVNDRTISSKIVDQLEKIIGKKNADKYRKIDTTDAQEYTTLLEKLYVMNMHGKIKMKGLYGKVHDIVTKELANKNTDYVKVLEKELNKEEFEYLKNITLQPDKPVYVDNIVDKDLGIERRVYIKSSSFALSPFLTIGTELDKLRIAMETQGVSRLAYSTATKVGNVANPATIWNEDGSISNNLTFAENSILELPRTGFRIQQEVPYDATKDAINKVSQASKNLLINMLEVDGFELDGKKVKGKELNKKYLKLYNELFRLQEAELFESLDYNPRTGELNIDKLKKVLEKEAIERNYPLADLQAFDLDTELRLLAFSPSASKYEALLNSIVTNRVIKMKFPGKSYVLGSEAGFVTGIKPVAQEDVNLEDFDIVWTEAYNGKELLAADGSGRPDQVILPWDFKENIDKFIGKDGIIDATKIPSKLLGRFGMRIPNQGPNSQSKIQVVGFFRSNVGDLIIAPKEYVIRMGSDFDVDKLYIYKYKTYSIDGKMYSNFPTNADEVRETIKKQLDSIEPSIRDLKNENKVIYGVVNDVFNKIKNINKSTLTRTEKNEKIEALEAEIANLVIEAERNKELNKTIDRLTNSLRNLKNAEKYVLWNQILDIHLAIHSNPDPRVQSQIHQPLGFWKLDTISKEIAEARKSTDKLFTGLSDEYQKNKFVNANAGKALVGVFSNDSMFNALVQGKGVALTNPNPKIPFSVKFGNNVSGGDLSSPYTLRTQAKLRKAIREKTDLTEKDVEKGYMDINEVNPYDFLKTEDIEYKSDVITGFQSGAVDNEKEQILDKINANTETSSTIKVMMMLGFDEEIPYFIAQDIIVDYVLELKKLRGLGDFVADVETKAKENVLSKTKYKADTSNFNEKQLKQLMDRLGNKDLTISKMKEMIKGSEGVKDYALTQQAILIKYLDLKIKGRTLAKAQSALNLDSQGIGKSFLEASIRNEEIHNELVNTIQGFENLIDPEQSIPGMALEFGLKNNTKLWNNLFPYNNPVVDETFKLLEKLYGKGEEIGRQVRAEFRTKMWGEIKKFRFSDPNLFIPRREDTKLITDPAYVESERRRLFIHSDENKSLARRVYEAKQKFGDNLFLKALEHEVRQNGQPSTVKFRASTKQAAKEEIMYEHFVDLLVNDMTISETDTTRKLFQDLVWGAYLNGGIQEASQYVKFIPAGYLHTVPFAQDMIQWIDSINSNERFQNGQIEETITPSVAIKQIVQNNPEGLPKATKEDFDIKDGSYFYKGNLLGTEGTSPMYLTMYDKTTSKGQKNFRLFERVGVNENNGKVQPVYVEIPVLGTSGRDKVSEYNYLKDGYISSIYSSKDDMKEVFFEGAQPISGPIQPTSSTTKMKKETTPFDVLRNKINLTDTVKNKVAGEKIITNVLRKISQNSTDGFNKRVATFLFNNIDKFDLSKMNVVLTKDLKTDTGAPAAGQFDPNTNQIKINTSVKKHTNLNGIEHTFIHEFIHAITKEQLDNPKTSLQKQVKENLDKLRKIAKDNIKNSEYAEAYEKFLKGDKVIRNKETDYFFYALDKHTDFVALMLGDENVQKVANEIMVDDKSAFQKFVDSIIKLIKELVPGIKKDSVLETSLESIIKLIEEPNIRNLEIEQPIEKKVARQEDDDVDTAEELEYLPEYMPTSRDIMKQYGELNQDGTPKKLAVSDNNYEIMRKRAVRINQGQPYYKARVGETMGENVSTKSKKFFRIYLSPKPELNDLNYMADIVPQNLIDEAKKQCR